MCVTCSVFLHISLRSVREVRLSFSFPSYLSLPFCFFLSLSHLLILSLSFLSFPLSFALALLSLFLSPPFAIRTSRNIHVTTEGEKTTSLPSKSSAVPLFAVPGCPFLSFSFPPSPSQSLSLFLPLLPRLVSRSIRCL